MNINRFKHLPGLTPACVYLEPAATLHIQRVDGLMPDLEVPKRSLQDLNVEVERGLGVVLRSAWEGSLS